MIDELGREFFRSARLPEKRIEHRARIRFTYDPANPGYAHLANSKTKCVAWDDATSESASKNPVHERGTMWTLGDGTAILEISVTGAEREPAVFVRLSSMAPAHVFHHEAASERPVLVPAAEFPQTDAP